VPSFDRSRLFGGIGRPAGGIRPAGAAEIAALERQLAGEPPEPHPLVQALEATAGVGELCAYSAPAAELEDRAPDHPELDRPYRRGAVMLALRPLRARAPHARRPHARRPACRPRGRRERRTARATRAGPSGDEPGSSEPPGPLAGRRPAGHSSGTPTRAAR
jgi:hypothetical protein